MKIALLLVAALLVNLPGAGSAGHPAQGGTVPLKLTSSAFTEGGAIPARYTCDGENVSPPLQWDAKPASAKSLVLILDDPDAPGGVFTHWVLYDVLIADADSGHIASGMAHESKNDFGRNGYGGPCPPRGHGAHRYFFTLSALDVGGLGLPAGASRQQVESKMRGHVIATAKLMGKYERK